jgi:hypothetical protein
LKVRLTTLSQNHLVNQRDGHMVHETTVLWTITSAAHAAQNPSTESVPLFETVSGREIPLMDSRQPRMFLICFSLALSGVLSTLCPLTGIARKLAKKLTYMWKSEFVYI